MIAPDSHRLTPVFGSSMAGTRPLTQRFSYGSFFKSAKSMTQIDLDWWTLVRRDAAVHTHHLVLVWNIELFQNHSHLPWIWTSGMAVKGDWLAHDFNFGVSDTE